METIEELVEKYEHMCKITVHKMFRNPAGVAESKHLQLDDLYQYARIGLWEACKTFPNDGKFTFQSWIIRNIKWSIGKFLKREEMRHSYYRYFTKKENKQIKLLSLNNKPSKEANDDDSFYDIISCDGINQFFNKQPIDDRVISTLEVDEILNMLKEKDREIVLMKFKEGLNDSEIANRLGVSRQAINVKVKRIQNQIQRHLGVATV